MKVVNLEGGAQLTSVSYIGAHTKETSTMALLTLTEANFDL